MVRLPVDRVVRCYVTRARSDHPRAAGKEEPLTDLFLHAPFDAPDLLACILGETGPPPSRRSTLAGVAPRTDPRGLRIALAPAPDAAASGSRLAVEPAARDRLDFAMAAFGAARTGVDSGDGPVEAYVFTDPPDRAWGPAGWPDEARARLRETLIEVMGHFGRRDPAELPGLLHGIGIRALGRVRAAGTAPPVRLGAGLGAANVQPIDRTFSYARYFGMEEHRLRHRRFDGRMSDVVDRAVFTSGDAVTVLPFDPRAGSVLLIEQFRAGPHARRDPRPWCLEAVAGRCDAIEPPEATARREAHEEAGLEIGRLEQVAAYYPSPGIMSEFITAFVGEADLSAAGGVHGLAEEHEDIRALVVPLDSALDAATAGEVNNAPLLLSLYWLALHRARLTAAWAGD